jgi:cell division protein FtsQ
MIKKILIFISYTLLLALVGGYFYFANILYRRGAEKLLCKNISITILDSSQNRFVSKNEIKEIISTFSGSPIGQKIGKLNLYSMENLLNRRSAIKCTQVSIAIDGRLNIDITQRKPVVRIETSNGGFYVDDTEFLFPLEYRFSSYVPIVSGYIPFAIEQGHRGKLAKNAGLWIHRITKIGKYLDNNEFWNNQIEQIYVSEEGEIALYPRQGPEKIIFGDMYNIEIKFKELYAFYKDIVPVYGWDRYNTINLKFKNQIVCTKNKIKK